MRPSNNMFVFGKVIQFHPSTCHLSAIEACLGHCSLGVARTRSAAGYKRLKLLLNVSRLRRRRTLANHSHDSWWGLEKLFFSQLLLACWPCFHSLQSSPLLRKGYYFVIDGIWHSPQSSGVRVSSAHRPTLHLIVSFSLPRVSGVASHWNQSCAEWPETDPKWTRSSALLRPDPTRPDSGHFGSVRAGTRLDPLWPELGLVASSGRGRGRAIELAGWALADSIVCPATWRLWPRAAQPSLLAVPCAAAPADT